VPIREIRVCNWCKFLNRADGISEIEGEGRRGDRASRAASEFQIRVCNWCKFVQFVSLFAGSLGCGKDLVEALITAQIIPARIEAESARG